MLKVTIPSFEMFDSKTNTFNTVKGQTINLEHSLISISKWEAKWNKPFMSSEKTPDQILDYIRMMTVTTNVDPNLYEGLTKKSVEEIIDYINSPQTATWFSENRPRKKDSTTVTSELIYYWMVSYQIPFECQKWHLNRLITLIRICDLKNKPSKKMSKREILANNAKLNAARRAKLNTRG